jgi:Zn-dependent peptidase ImmA (M78 family)
MELDGVGSPAGLAARIHELLPDLPYAVPLEPLCQQLDIASIEQIETSAFEAALVMDELKAAGAILLAAGRRPERSRFSIAHELGHFLIQSHRPQPGHPFECSYSDLHQRDTQSGDRRKRIEAEANRFAAHLLMPPKKVRAMIGRSRPDLQAIVAMSREFGVSKEAMARSWLDEYREPAAIIVARNEKIERQYRNDDFPWLPTKIGDPLPPDSLVASCTVDAGTYTAAEEVEPDAWLTEREAKRVLALTEQVRGQSDGYAMVLLLAEMDED